MTLSADNRRARAYIPELDGLRAVAIGLVMAFHFGGMRGGWIGVDLFFVLSGFLITGICLDHPGPGLYLPFYARRALRILPAYALTIALVVFVMPMITGQSPRGMLWVASFTTNVGVSLAGTWNVVPRGSLHFWTLAVEEQFYMVWPLAVAVLSVRRVGVVAATAIPLALVVRIWLLSHGASWIAAYTLTPARMDTLAIGAVLAIAYRACEPPAFLRRLGGAPLLLWIAGLIVICDGISYLSADDPAAGTAVQTVGYSVIALLAGTTLAAMLAADASSQLRRALRSRVMVAVGRLSYGMYLLHLPLRDVLVLRGVKLPSFFAARGLAVLGLCAVTYGLAVVSWTLVERPALALKRFFPYGCPRDRPPAREILV